MVWKEQLDSRAEAMNLEKRIKKQGAKRFLERSKVESRLRRD